MWTLQDFQNLLYIPLLLVLILLVGYLFKDISDESLEQLRQDPPDARDRGGPYDIG